MSGRGLLVESDSHTWSRARAAIHERLRALPEFALTRAQVVDQAIAECRGRSVAEMRALGGFSEVLSRIIAALPPELRVNHGSKLLPTSIADEVRFEIPAMRAEVQSAVVRAGRAP